MVYRVVILAEALEELRRFFPQREQQRITRKIRHIAENIPDSLKLRGVTYLKGAEAALSRIGGDAAYEVRIGSGYRAAFVIFNRLCPTNVILRSEATKNLKSGASDSVKYLQSRFLDPSLRSG